MSENQQRKRVTDALVKVLGLAVVLGVGLSLGSYLLITSIGLSGVEDTPSSAEESPSELPTKALDEEESVAPEQQETEEPEESTSARPKKRKPIQLAASPVMVRPSERINLTGSYPGRDGLSLQVQRKEGGQWTSFGGVTASVRVGRYQTYVLTSRVGEQRFRMFDPGSGRASNVVRVTVR